MPGERFCERSGVALPCGWGWMPAVEPELLRDAWNLGPQDLALVATDGSASGSAALDAALELAASDGDAVVVLTVWRHPRGSFEPRDELGPELEAVERDLARGVLETALADARLADVPTEGLIREGNPAVEICAASCRGVFRAWRAKIRTTARGIISHVLAFRTRFTSS